MIVHVAYSGVGGTGSFVSDLCPRLGRHGGKDAAVIFYGVEPLHEDYGRRLSIAGIPYSVVRKRPGINLDSLQTLADHIRASGADIVVMHGGGTAWHWPILRLMGLRAPLVLVEHGPESAYLTPQGFIRHTISILSATAVVAVSERLAERMMSVFSLPLRAMPVAAVSNGIDTDFFTPGAVPRQAGLVFMSGTLSPSKDHETLLRAVALLTRRQPARLVLAGDGILRKQLELLASELGIGNKVMFLGNVGREELLRLYREAEVFAFATRGEGSPLSLLEAMSCTLPVVASDVIGVRGILSGRDCGILVTPQNPAEMATAIEHILKDRASARRMAANARQYVALNHSADLMAGRYRELLNAICSRAPHFTGAE